MVALITLASAFCLPTADNDSDEDSQSDKDEDQANHGGENDAEVIVDDLKGKRRLVYFAVQETHLFIQYFG